MSMFDQFESPGDMAASVPLSVLRMGHPASPRGQMTFEVIHAAFRIEQPWRIPFNIENRNLNHDISRLEILSLLGQTSADAAQRKHVGALAAFQHDGVQWGNYGDRIRNQLWSVVQALIYDKRTRQAVMTVYDGRMDHTLNEDIPCTLSFQFLIRDDRLHTIVTMRSNDVFLGMPYDLHQFCALHCAVAQVVDVTPGPLHYNVGSLHAYERDFERIHELGDPVDFFYPTQQWFAMSDLLYITTFCQDSLADGALASTRFEKWLTNWGSGDVS